MGQTAKQRQEDGREAQNPHKKHRQRVKEEFRKAGLDHFADHRVLEMLLFSCVQRKDTNPLAHRLLDRFGSISSVLAASYDLLMEVEGVSLEVATHIKFMQAFTQRHMMDIYSSISHIKTTEQAKDYMRYRFLADERERVILVCLSQSGRILLSETIATGTLEKVEIAPANVLRQCMRANAAKALLSHNHPGGFCNPSRSDKQTTQILYAELRRMGIELFDHVIVASDGELSMLEHGMLTAPNHPDIDIFRQ